jgi:hypothetical protein
MRISAFLQNSLTLERRHDLVLEEANARQEILDVKHEIGSAEVHKTLE